MKAVLCKAYGPPESLVLEDVPSPAVGPKEVKVAVHYAGLNFPDTLIIAGTYQFKPPFPFSPGMEVSGTVLEVGSEVTGIKVGQRVMATTGHGGFAEEVVAPMEKVYPLPDKVSFEAAAAIPVTYGTTYHGLVDRGHLKPGEWLLVHGATGGVGLNAVEMGKMLGAKVIATGGSDEKLAIAKQYGADHLVNYSREKIRDRVKEITGGTGADVIYDPVGGEVGVQSLRCLAYGARYLVIGFAGGALTSLPANRLLLHNASALGVLWGEVRRRDPGLAERLIRQVFAWHAEGRLSPLSGASFPFEAAREALAALEGRATTGKAWLRVGPSSP